MHQPHPNQPRCTLLIIGGLPRDSGCWSDYDLQRSTLLVLCRAKLCFNGVKNLFVEVPKFEPQAAAWQGEYLFVFDKLKFIVKRVSRFRQVFRVFLTAFFMRRDGRKTGGWIRSYTILSSVFRIGTVDVEFAAETFCLNHLKQLHSLARSIVRL